MADEQVQPAAAQPMTQVVPSPRINHAAVQYGDRYEKGVSVLLVGHPGCLSGDTEIKYKRGKRDGSRTILLKDLYRKFNGLSVDSSRPWVDITIPTYAHSIDNNGVVFYNKIEAVISSGRKKCFRVALDDESCVICTADHKFLTSSMEYVSAANVAGLQVLTKGSMKPVKGSGKNYRRARNRTIAYVKMHRYGTVRTVTDKRTGKKYRYKQISKSRLVAEAAINGLAYPDFLALLNGTKESLPELVFLPPGIEVHHKDRNKRNDARENLELLSKRAHAKLHGNNSNFSTEYFKEATVLSVEEVGTQDTYDITMDQRAPNFAANGVFVHNSWKSTWAAQWPGVVFLSIASEGGDDSVKPDSFLPVITQLTQRSRTPECPPSFNVTAPHVFSIRSTVDFSQYIQDIVMNAKAWGVCTVVVDSLTYLIDLWIRELIEHKSKADKNWMNQVKKRGGDFLGPPEWGLLNMFLAKIRVDLGNTGVNVIWTALQNDTYSQSGTNMQERTLSSVEPMITGKNRVTLPGACKLHIWAEKKWVQDPQVFGQQIVQPVFWTSSSSKARWVRHRYGLKFPQGMLVDPEFGTLPTFRAVWAELSNCIYVG